MVLTLVPGFSVSATIRSRKLDGAVLDQATVPSRLAPGEELAWVHPVALRDGADACPRLQRLGDHPISKTRWCCPRPSDRPEPPCARRRAGLGASRSAA